MMKKTVNNSEAGNVLCQESKCGKKLHLFSIKNRSEAFVCVELVKLMSASSLHRMLTFVFEESSREKTFAFPSMVISKAFHGFVNLFTFSGNSLNSKNILAD